MQVNRIYHPLCSANKHPHAQNSGIRIIGLAHRNSNRHAAQIKRVAQTVRQIAQIRVRQPFRITLKNKE